MVKTSTDEFRKFVSLLPQPPVLIPLTANDKIPSVPKGESWKAPQFFLSVEAAEKRLSEGLNVGVVGCDGLVITDHDDPEKFIINKETLTVLTRNGRLHKYWVNGGDVKNADGKGALRGCGEVRAEWKYAAAPGSYVPPDARVMNNADGLYKVIKDVRPAVLLKEDLPSDMLPIEAEREVKLIQAEPSYRNCHGWALQDICLRDPKLKKLLENDSSSYPSASEADMATLTKLKFWEYDDSEAVQILKLLRPRDKLDRDDYIQRTLSKISNSSTISRLVDIKTWDVKTGSWHDITIGRETPCSLCVYEIDPHHPCPLDEKPTSQCESLVFKPWESEKFANGITKEQVALYIIEMQSYKTLKDTEEILVYSDGIYVPNGETEIKIFLEKHCRDITTHQVNEITAHVQRKTYAERADFDRDPNLLTLQNGILDIKNMELCDFSPDHLSMVKFPVTHNKGAKCEAIDRFLSEIVAPQDVVTLYEIAGYCLLKRYFIHKAFMLVGETHSGKTTYQRLLCALLGKDNVSYVSLQNLLVNRFSTSDLYGKLLNSYDDIPATSLKQTGIFKVLTGESPIRAEQKLKNAFYFENYAKLIFSCNEMPRTYDKTDAFYIRWILINFPNRFDDKNPKTDKKLIEKLTAPEEMSGFFNKALESARTLLEQAHFTNNPDIEDIKEYYEKLSNPIYAFMADMCLQDDRSEIPKDEFYRKLMVYCEERRLSKPTLTFLSQELKRLKIETIHGIGGSRNYKGLRWMTEDEKTDYTKLDNY